jgi:hypothetical protein
MTYGGAEVLVGTMPGWEPTLSAMGACRNLARCRGIADKVGSHPVYSILMAASLDLVGAASAAMGACLGLARCRGIADKVGCHRGMARPRTPIKEKGRGSLRALSMLPVSL